MVKPGPRKAALDAGEKYYQSGQPCPSGHIGPRLAKSGGCVECARSRNAAWRATPEGREAGRQYAQQYHQTKGQTPEQRRKAVLRAMRNEAGKRHLPEFKEAARKRTLKYLSTEKGKSRRADYLKRPHVVLSEKLRSVVRSALKRRSAPKKGSPVLLLGCTPEHAAAYLETKFLPGMTWDNHGEWHIDHIRPLSSFDLGDPQQLAAACQYTNLQPLWAEDNLAKGSKWQSGGGLL